ncbi:cobalamin biosynthesis protein [Mariniluteicoccus flavus]
MSASGLLYGFLADLVVGDPRHGHPVAAFGTAATKLEDAMYADSRGRGVAYLTVCAFAAKTPAVVLEELLHQRPRAYALATAATTWAVLGGKSLVKEGTTIANQLEMDALPDARNQLRNLVGRETAELDAKEIARATIESIAENTSDAVVAPLFWGALFGLPGLVGYRVVNTLDAMVGHRTPRLERFGWASAKVDDLANWIPARLAAGLAIAAAPLVEGRPAAALAAVRRDAHQHPSPNAGQVEAAFAGALGVRLGGTNTYAGVSEDRGVLGDGREVVVADIRRAVRLSWVVQLGSLALAVGARAVISWGAPRLAGARSETV